MKRRIFKTEDDAIRETVVIVLTELGLSPKNIVIRTLKDRNSIRFDCTDKTCIAFISTMKEAINDGDLTIIAL